MNERSKKPKQAKASPKSPRTKERRSRWFWAYKSSCRVLLLITLTMTLVYAWLHFVGVPEFLLERVRAEARDEGLVFDAGKMHVNLFEGLVEVLVLADFGRGVHDPVGFQCEF